MSLSTAAICFIACHGGPADHFAIFAEDLVKKGYSVEIHAAGPAFQKFESRGFSAIPFSTEEPASIVAGKCKEALVIITDLGHTFDIDLQNALADQAPSASRFTYYDNPESFVPGGYSDIAAKVMQVAQKVLFANSHLTPTIAPEKGIPIGYYPMEQVDKIIQRRKDESQTLRSQFFSKHSLEDKGQKVLVYVGGNNEEYFSKAFPAFLKFLSETSEEELSNFVIILQQHPGAKAAGRDVMQIQDQKIFISDFNSDDAQVLSDAILYYQTSMGPQFALAGIPTIQVGHKIYEDILVRNNLCSVATTKETLMEAMTHLAPNIEGLDAIKKGLGLDANWANNLEQAIKK